MSELMQISNMETIYFIVPLYLVGLLALLWSTRVWIHERNLTASLVVASLCAIFIAYNEREIALVGTAVGFTVIVLYSLFKKREHKHDKIVKI